MLQMKFKHLLSLQVHRSISMKTKDTLLSDEDFVIQFKGKVSRL